jgi:hypothetical protein
METLEAVKWRMVRAMVQFLVEPQMIHAPARFARGMAWPLGVRFRCLCGHRAVGKTRIICGVPCGMGHEFRGWWAVCSPG